MSVKIVAEGECSGRLRQECEVEGVISEFGQQCEDGVIGSVRIPDAELGDEANTTSRHQRLNFQPTIIKSTVGTYNQSVFVLLPAKTTADTAATVAWQKDKALKKCSVFGWCFEKMWCIWLVLGLSSWSEMPRICHFLTQATFFVIFIH